VCLLLNSCWVRRLRCPHFRGLSPGTHEELGDYNHFSKV
jgi:hypothetical protein